MDRSQFKSTVCRIPCIIRVVHYEEYVPEIFSTFPECHYPAEGGRGEWEVLDRRGRPAPWLERKLAEKERDRIDGDVFEYMESEAAPGSRGQW